MGKRRERKRRDRVKEASAECKSLWVLRWLPRDKIDEMIAETEVDLTVAEEYGCSVEKVLGTKRVYRYAELRADAHQKPLPSHLSVGYSADAGPATPSLRFLLLTWVYAFLLAAALVLLPQHVFFTSLTFPLTLEMLVAVLSAAVAVMIFRWPWLAARTWNRIRHEGVFFRGDYAIFLVGLAASYFLDVYDPLPSNVVTSWSWPASAVLVACYIACERAVAKRDPTATPTSGQAAANVEQPDQIRARSVERLGLRVMIFSFLGLVLGWWLSEERLHELSGLLVVLSAYLLFLMLPTKR